MRIITLDDTSMKDLLADMLRRDPNNYDSYTKTVEAIVENVKKHVHATLFCKIRMQMYQSHILRTYICIFYLAMLR